MYSNPKVKDVEVTRLQRKRKGLIGRIDLSSTADFETNLDDNRDGRTDSWHTNITDNDVIIDPYEFPVGKEPGPSQVPSFQVLCHSHNTHISILFLYS
jgi:hypothetical protein